MIQIEPEIYNSDTKIILSSGQSPLDKWISTYSMPFQSFFQLPLLAFSRSPPLCRPPLAPNGMAAWRRRGKSALPFKSTRHPPLAPNRSLGAGILPKMLSLSLLFPLHCQVVLSLDTLIVSATLSGCIFTRYGYRRTKLCPSRCRPFAPNGTAAGI